MSQTFCKHIRVEPMSALSLDSSTLPANGSSGSWVLGVLPVFLCIQKGTMLTLLLLGWIFRL